MYYKQSSNVIYRDYGSFGYITDNRNFGYKLTTDDESYIGDKIVSESGAVFLSELSRSPQSIECLTEKICKRFLDVDYEIIKKDAIEFYSMLENEGFVISGDTFEKCNKNDAGFSYKKNKYKRLKNTHIINKGMENTTQAFFDKYFNNEPQLTSIHVEITSRCNERCIHCYIPHENKTEIMSTQMFYDIIKQAREMKVLHVTISGGEPMTHNDFVKILRICDEYNFSVNVLSNLTILNDDIVKEMKHNHLLCVQTSIYSMDSHIHDSITQKKGSLDKTIASILTLIENDIPVQISCPIMKQNIDCYLDVVKWARLYNLNVNSDYVIIGCYDYSARNVDCRVELNDIRKIINQRIDMDYKYLSSLEKEYNKKRDMRVDDYICSVCNSSICISETGNVYPCAGWQGYTLGNIKNTKLKDIWKHSEKVNYLRNLRRRDFPKCLSCTEKEFCTMCMVRNANEHPQGDPLELNNYFCDIAKINKEVYFNRKHI